MQKLRVLFPGKRPPPRPRAEPLLPGPLDAPIELPQAAVVRGPSVVLVMAAEFRVESGLLPVHVVVTMCLAPLGDSLQRPPQALLHRLDVNGEPPSSATRALVGKSEEVERVGVRPRPARALAGFAAKRQPARRFPV